MGLATFVLGRGGAVRDPSPRSVGGSALLAVAGAAASLVGLAALPRADAPSTSSVDDVIAVALTAAMLAGFAGVLTFAASRLAGTLRPLGATVALFFFVVGVPALVTTAPCPSTMTRRQRR
jgi:hypothetical protein